MTNKNSKNCQTDFSPFQPLEVVDRGSDTQPQVAENRFVLHIASVRDTFFDPLYGFLIN